MSLSFKLSLSEDGAESKSLRQLWEWNFSYNKNKQTKKYEQITQMQPMQVWIQLRESFEDTFENT